MKQERITTKLVRQLLDEVRGANVIGTADNLLQHNITGKPQSPEHCPMAEYLRKETGERFVSVDEEICVGGTRENPHIRFATPKFVEAFVSMYDTLADLCKR